MENRYSETHITLLTYIRSVVVLGQQELVEALRKVCVAYGNNEDEVDEIGVYTLDGYVSTINTTITPTGFRIAKYRNQATQKIYYIFINIISDSITKTNTTYTAGEIECIKKIVDDMMDSNFLYSLGYVNLSQRISQALNKTAREANAMLNRLIEDGWFELTEEDRLILSMRGLCELKSYLIDRYGMYAPQTQSTMPEQNLAQQEDGKEGRLLACSQCRELVTIGFKCSVKECLCAFHAKCLDFYFRLQAEDKDSVLGVDLRCPNYDECGYNWASLELVPQRVGVLPESLT